MRKCPECRAPLHQINEASFCLDCDYDTFIPCFNPKSAAPNINFPVPIPTLTPNRRIGLVASILKKTWRSFEYIVAEYRLVVEERVSIRVASTPVEQIKRDLDVLVSCTRGTAKVEKKIDDGGVVFYRWQRRN